MTVQIFDSELCARCKGRGFCKRPCRIYSKLNLGFKTKTHFSGESPPEIFVGRFNYPNIYAGILSPDGLSSTEEMSMPEIWHEKRFSIGDILTRRGQLVYGRFRTQIKQGSTGKKFLSVMQEISMAYKSVSTEFYLKKVPKQNLEINNHSPIIANPAQLESVRLEENPMVKPKVDYLVSDGDAKSVVAIKELYRDKIPVSNIMKILSAGLLGLRSQRKLVPTRWSITTVDDTLSRDMLKKIRYYPEVSNILLFNSEYNGNHYEIILLPDKFSFEVIEAEVSGSLWNQTRGVKMWQDYEFFNGRRNYAYNVTGAYYANRFALCEYFERIKKQATAIFFREVRPEYYAPLGVGILREVAREAFKHIPDKFETIGKALISAQKRLRLPISTFSSESILLRNFGKQRKLNQWF